MAHPQSPTAIPVLLLKTKSSPGDAYEDLFSSPSSSSAYTFKPSFVPVLLHNFSTAGLSSIRTLLSEHAIGTHDDASYGGLIFTSQRAVEAFTSLVHEPAAPHPSWPHLHGVPVYSVGPATTRALTAVTKDPPLQVFGSHTGNGATLGPYILSHYGEWYSHCASKPPLLFLVGEQRRDIIPKTLASPDLPATMRIPVTETVVYGTDVMESFPADFARLLDETQGSETRWIVVFSPTGCDSFLEALGILDPETGRARPGSRDGKTFVATIGPTTRDHLRSFGFEPDVCAEAPSPEGVLEGILEFMSRRS